MADWTTPDDVAARVRRSWTSGELLRSYGSGLPFDPLDLPLRGPRVGDIAGDLEQVRSWVERLDRAAPGRFTVVRKPVGGRVVGRNELPHRVVVASYDEVWRLLDVEADVAAYDGVLALVRDDEPALAWVLAKPHAALAVGDDWPALLAARRWLDTHRDTWRFVRTITAPGVDTKFVERHRATLAQLLGVPAAADKFEVALGLHPRPSRVRLRFDRGFAGLSRELTEATFRLDEVSELPVSVRTAVVIENEVTFLSAPVPPEGVLVFGEGFRAARAGALPWLADVPVHYWGDLDTHGFAILDRIRAWLPQTESFLMDAATLLAHRDRWGSEPSPTRAALTRLDDAERAVYSDLVTDRYADRLRLEQERIDWAWAMEHWPVTP